MLRVNSLSYTYEGARDPAFSDVSLSAGAGECLCITGHSGCGKTTLLLAIKGLLHRGKLTGLVEVDAPESGAGPARDAVGLVFQNAESQNFCSTVAEEVAFGPENLCVRPDEIGERIRSSLEAVRLLGFWDRNVERLSAGQKHRLAIGSVLSMSPRLLLLDEPTAQLDAVGKAEVVGVLRDLKDRGYALLVTEHNLEPLQDLVDRYVLMVNGRIQAVSDRVPAECALSQVFKQGAETTPGSGAGLHDRQAITAEDLHLSYPGVGPVLRGLTFAAAKGERIHVYGQNGCGKSSLLACIAGAVQPDSGSITLAGARVTESARLFGKVGYLLQNPQRQLFEDTVLDEVAFSLKRLRLPPSAVQQRVTEALELCEAAHLVNRLPLSLSFGEQHRVALASVLAPRPQVLLLDEPFSGLDLRQRQRLLRILASLRAKHSTTVLLASHDPAPDRSWPDRVLTMEDGKIG